MADRRACALVILIACARDPVAIEAPQAIVKADASAAVDLALEDAGTDSMNAGDADDERASLMPLRDAAAAGLSVVGALDVLAVKRVVIARRSAFVACFEIEASRNPDLSGRARFSWMIDPAGTVTIARLDGSTLGESRVEGCILRQIRALRFPSAATATHVLGFPMTFRMTE